GGAADAADVVVDVEVGVFYPHGVVEVERHVDQAPTEGWHQVEPLGDEVLDLLEGVAAGHGAGVEHHGHGHVHVVGGRLEVEECGVESGETFHGCPLHVGCGWRFCHRIA